MSDSSSRIRWWYSRLPDPQSHAPLEYEITIKTLGDPNTVKFAFKGGRWHGGELVSRSVVADAMGRSVDYVQAMEESWIVARNSYINSEEMREYGPEVPECLSRVPFLSDARKHKPNIGYVYFLVDGPNVVYIGQTYSLGERIKNHTKDKVFTAAFFMPVRCKELTATERKYIVKFAPKYNSHNISEYHRKARRLISTL